MGHGKRKTSCYYCCLETKHFLLTLFIKYVFVWNIFPSIQTILFSLIVFFRTNYNLKNIIDLFLTYLNTMSEEKYWYGTKKSNPRSVGEWVRNKLLPEERIAFNILLAWQCILSLLFNIATIASQLRQLSLSNMHGKQICTYI